MAAGFVALLFLSSGRERGDAAEDEELERGAEPAKLARPERPAPKKLTPRPAPPLSTMVSEGPRVVGPHPDDPHEPGMLPHPMTEEHERIQSENRTIQALNDAMAFRDVTKMRELLVEYRRIDPSDIEFTQAGYEVIADCIEFPGDASLAAAREFYDTQRHSPLRRFVRRICFENSPEATGQPR